MANICENCGKRPEVGHKVSYSQHKTKRRFMPNLVEKRLWNAQTKKLVPIKVCTRCLKTLTKKM